MLNSYILNLLFYNIISIFIILTGVFIFHKKNIKFYIFIFYIISLLSLTVLPKVNIDNGLYFTIYDYSKLSLIPLHIIKDTINELKHNNYYYLLINVIGNIIAFIPLGYLLKSLYNLKDKYIILIGFLSSFLIEFIELFIGRETDIDDILLNVIGTIIGLIIYKKSRK